MEAQAQVRQAATVVLTRQGHTGPEVLMVRRSVSSDFNAGAYVFPGGAVDDGDRAGDWRRHCVGLDEQAANRRIGIVHGGMAFWVAAVREAFEEVGVLIARARGGGSLLLDGPAAYRFSAAREGVRAGTRSFLDFVSAEALEIPLSEVHYYSHWITPRGMPRRYDTRFFVCAAPAGQEGLADGEEVDSLCWIAPATALRRHRAGDFPLVPATRKQLEFLAGFASVQTVLDAAAQVREVQAIEPRLEFGPDGRPVRVWMPGADGEEAVSLKGVLL